MDGMDKQTYMTLADEMSELSGKTLAKLQAAGIASVGQLTECTRSRVFKILSGHWGRLNEVQQALQARGLAFNKGNRRGRKPFLGLEGTRNEGKNVMVSQFDHQIIRRMLEDGMRHSEIAHIVGCSRERVRQLDKKWFGKCGMDRARELSWERLEAAAQRRDEELQKEIDRLFQTHPFVRGARERGFEVTILEHGISPTVLVNGHCCLLRKLYRFQGAKGKRRMYYRIHGPRLQGGEIDFYVHALGDTIMIIPPEKMPTSDTSCFVLEHTNNMGAWSHRHDWPNYINAWHYLEKKK